MRARTVIGGIVTLAAALAVIIFLRTSDDGNAGVKVGVGVGQAEASQCDEEQVDAYECMPEVDFVDIDGQVFTPDSYEGKVVMINFWATWCKPCKIEVPHLTRAYQKYKDEGFVLFGVMTDENNNDQLERFSRAYRLDYPVIRADYPIMDAWGMPSGLPTTFIYDRTGKLVYDKTGVLREHDLERILEPLLAE